MLHPLLLVSGVALRFGGVSALSGVDFTVAEGELAAIIGPNGAGKTSLLNVLSGLYRPQQGAARFRTAAGVSVDLCDRSPHQRARLGIARTFQNIELFRHLTVLENLMLGRHAHLPGNLLSCAFYLGPQRRREVEHRLAVERIIDFLEIVALRHRPVGTLAYGLQKRVELGRALAISPRLLLLDEPMAGMNAEEKEDMARFVLDLNEEWNITCVLIEHDMGVVMDLSDSITVLDFGTVIASGPPAAVAADPRVLRAYLGESTS